MKIIPGFEKYLITENGEVHSTFKGGKILKPRLAKGYYGHGLFKADGIKRVNVYVHRLVALTYIPNTENKPVINHKDGNKKNNHYSNLEWTTVKENSRHAADSGLYDIRYGSRNHTSKMVLNTQTGIIYDTIREAAESTGVMCRHKLRHMLTGFIKNKTNFIFA